MRAAASSGGAARGRLRCCEETRLATPRNLGPRAQGAWLRAGVLFVGVALLFAVALRDSGATALARLVVFVPLFLGAYGLRAGLEKTCGFCAVVRRRITDEGPEPVVDPIEIRSLRRAGIRAMVGSASVAALGAIVLTIAE